MSFTIATIVSKLFSHVLLFALSLCSCFEEVEIVEVDGNATESDMSMGPKKVG